MANSSVREGIKYQIGTFFQIVACIIFSTLVSVLCRTTFCFNHSCESNKARLDRGHVNRMFSVFDRRVSVILIDWYSYQYHFLATCTLFLACYTFIYSSIPFWSYSESFERSSYPFLESLFLFSDDELKSALRDA